VERQSVDPAFTFGVSLALSVVLWYPTLRQTMNGNIEITDSGIRYLLALAVAWAGVFGVSSVVAMCASSARKPSPRPPDPGLHAAAPVRSTDRGRPATKSASEDVDSNAA
jgi:hypothetical protein